jgi:hypothetical protein
MYILQYSAPLDKYDTYLPTAQKIASTFVITSTGLQKAVGAIVVVVAGIVGISGFMVLKVRRKRESLTALFLRNMRQLLPAALGIEILCLSAAEIGGNARLYLFGFIYKG